LKNFYHEQDEQRRRPKKNHGVLLSFGQLGVPTEFHGGRRKREELSPRRKARQGRGGWRATNKLRVCIIIFGILMKKQEECDRLIDLAALSLSSLYGFLPFCSLWLV